MRPLWLAGCVAVVSMPAAAQEYHVDRTASNLVRFVSKAPLDEFEGVTDRIDGYVLLRGDGLDRPAAPGQTEIYFEVELAGLDTGIGLRNRHMRDRYLDVEAFPHATFRGTAQRVERLSPGEYRILARGTMAIHGVERPLTPECAVGQVESRMRVRCEFVIGLADFDIEIPKLMFMKISEEVRIELDYWLRPAQPTN
jgi:polyisoprenoid-binding protein YceI